MIDWSAIQIRDVLTALALVVGGAGFVLSLLNFLRDRAAKSVNAWITVARASPEWLVCTLHVKNNSHLDIEIEKLGSYAPDFHLGDMSEAPWVTDSMGNPTHLDVSKVTHHLAMAFNYTVKAGDQLQKQFLLYQPAHSRKRSTSVRVMYWKLTAKKKWCIMSVDVKTRPDL